MAKKVDDTKTKFLLTEYSSLRDEIQKRNSNHYQMVSLNLIIASSILTFGLQSSSSVSVLFIIPIISVLLATVSAHNVIAGKWLGVLTKNHIETQLGISRQESLAKQSSFPGSLGVIATSGIFIVIEILALVLGLLKIQIYAMLDIVLISADGLAILITLILAYRTIKQAQISTF